MEKRKRFIFGGILLSLVGLAMRGVSLALGAYISKAVGAEGVGLNSLVMNVYGFALTFSTAGISLSVTALVASAIGENDSKKTRGVLSGAFIYAAAFGISGSLLLFFLGGLIGNHIIGDPRSVQPLMILSFSLFPSAVTAVVSGYFIGTRRVSLNAVLQVGAQVVRVVLTVLLLRKIATGDVERATAALAIGVTLTELAVSLLSLFEFFIDRIKEKGGRGHSSETRAVLQMALPLAFSAYIRSALLTLEHSLIPKRLRSYGEDASEALSSYGYLHGMALPLLLYPMVPLSSFGSLLLPEFAEAKSRGEIKRMERIASQALEYTLSYASLVSVFLLFFSEELGYTVYGSYSAGRFIALLAPVVPIMYLDHVADNMLKGIGEQVYSMWINIIDSVLSVVLVYVLIPVLGIGGYAVVIIAMEGFNFFFSILRLRKKIAFKIGLLKSLAAPLALAALSVFVSKRLFGECGINVRAGVSVSKILFAFLLFLLLKMLTDLIFKRNSRSASYKTASNTTISANPSKSE